MSVPFIADAAARCFSGLSALAPKANRRLPDIPADTYRTHVPTRFGPVRCTVYRPPAGEAGRPAVYVNAHGGGFVIRYPEQDDPLCRYLALRAGVAVLNVDYVVAPRHRFPDPVDQIYDVVRWAAGADREWDGARLCVGGQSAGGALAAGAARLALEGGGPPIALQVLHYAALDLVTEREPGGGSGGRPVVPIWMAEMFHTAYVPDPAQRRDRLASPAWGANGEGIEGIAAALVITAERDPLRAGGAAYAGKLTAAGCLAEYRDVPGADHGYDIVGNDEALIRQMYDVIVDHVIRATGGGSRLP